mmetsp:Transcript_81489/g.128307  ORF Transcript_81489/g.128307 Transcript_81489/m.128307 type:complete len:212 (-) Transcript_81489:602-1237(-)
MASHFGLCATCTSHCTQRSNRGGTPAAKSSSFPARHSTSFPHRSRSARTSITSSRAPASSKASTRASTSGQQSHVGDSEFSQMADRKATSLRSPCKLTKRARIASQSTRIIPVSPSSHKEHAQLVERPPESTKMCSISCSVQGRGFVTVTTCEAVMRINLKTVPCVSRSRRITFSHRELRTKPPSDDGSAGSTAPLIMRQAMSFSKPSSFA